MISTLLFQPNEGNFEVKRDESLIKTFEQMQKIVDEGSTQIVDTRRPPNFLQELPEPSESNGIFINSQSYSE